MINTSRLPENCLDFLQVRRLIFNSYPAHNKTP